MGSDRRAALPVTKHSQPLISSFCNAFCVGPMDSLVKPFTLYFSADSVRSDIEVSGQLYEDELMLKDSLQN